MIIKIIILRFSIFALCYCVSVMDDYIYCCSSQLAYPTTTCTVISHLSRIEAPIERSGIADCSCHLVLVLGAGRLISVLGPGPLSRFLNLSCGRATDVVYEYVFFLKCKHSEMFGSMDLCVVSLEIILTKIRINLVVKVLVDHNISN